MIESVSPERLRAVAARVSPLRGWDFSRLKTDIDAVPWVYEQVIQEHLSPSDCILDIGTGGGEVSLRLAPFFASGVGTDVDASMIAAARENLSPQLSPKVRFATMPAGAIEFADASFDVVLNRHAPVVATEVGRLLRPGGLFITQQVGAGNTQNIFRALGWASNAAYMEALHRERGEPPPNAIADLVEELESLGVSIVRADSYDVPYYFGDLESLVFWLKAVPVPMSFDDDANLAQIASFIDANRTDRGVRTNEHRDLIVARKAAG